MVSPCSILVVYACMFQACSLRITDPQYIDTAYKEETAVVPFQLAFGTIQRDGPAKDGIMGVRMSAKEKDLFGKLLRNASSYVEFGAGGSTVYALSFDNLKRIDVVESDPDWVGGLQNRHDIQQAIESGKLHFHLVEIGKTGAWGHPLDRSDQTTSKFHTYSDAGASVVESSGTDFVLVDGRFRVACFLKVLKASTPQTIIAIHDYTNRPQYHVVEKFADVIERSEEFVAFRKKEIIDETELGNTINQYETNPAFFMMPN